MQFEFEFECEATAQVFQSCPVAVHFNSRWTRIGQFGMPDPAKASSWNYVRMPFNAMKAVPWRGPGLFQPRPIDPVHHPKPGEDQCRSKRLLSLGVGLATFGRTPSGSQCVRPKRRGGQPATDASAYACVLNIVPLTQVRTDGMPLPEGLAGS